MISLFTSALNVTGNLVSPMPNWLHVLKATMCFCNRVARILLRITDEEDVFKDETKKGRRRLRRLLSGAHTTPHSCSRRRRSGTRTALARFSFKSIPTERFQVVVTRFDFQDFQFHFLIGFC